MSTPIEGGHPNIARRHNLNLRSWVLVTAVRISPNEQEHFYFLRALALNVSLTGLALIVSSQDAEAIRALSTVPLIRLLLPLLGKPMELELEPVRYEQILDGDHQTVLIGARIIDMETDDRLRFEDAIRKFSNS